MHPREGYSEDGTRRRGGGMSRRDFLARIGTGVGAGVALSAAGGLLSACGKSSATTGTTTGGPAAIPLPRPNSPVTWDFYSTNKAIASGLQPEQGATLQIYNWVAYINQACVDAFCKKYNCKAQITTFNTMSEAIAKLQTGELPFDIFFPTIDVLGPLVEGKIIRPLTHSYIPNISQAWKEFENPFYDQGWRYTSPYTIYTTGISWRKDHVDENPYTMPNPWAMPWQPKYKGKVAVLDDYRETISLGLMKEGIFDLNTTESSQIAASLAQLQLLDKEVNVQIDNNDYTNIPDGQAWIHHAWSGDMAAAASYMPKGVPVEVVGYWFPPDGKGPVANDLMAIVSAGKNPVLANLFINYMLDLPNVLENISYNGYMQPIEGVTPQVLVKEQILPPSLLSTIVLPSYFDRGIMELALPTAADDAWEDAWVQFSHGL
jgi:spermidine/putrescine transport system substrate-binding protein